MGTGAGGGFVLSFCSKIQWIEKVSNPQLKQQVICDVNDEIKINHVKRFSFFFFTIL